MRMKRTYIITAALALVLCLSLPALGAMSNEDFIKLCEEGTLQQVKTALIEGADVNAKGKYNRTALM